MVWSGSTFCICETELLPGPVAPEVVDDEKAAGQQVIAQRQGFGLGQRHRADLDRVQERVTPQARVGQFDRVVLGPGVDQAQAFERDQELAVRLGVVDRPAAALVVIVELAAVDRAREVELVRIAGRLGRRLQGVRRFLRAGRHTVPSQQQA